MCSCRSPLPSATMAAAVLRAHTEASSRELLANRLAPCRPVQATSPQAYNPGMAVRPSTPASTPPQK